MENDADLVIPLALLFYVSCWLKGRFSGSEYF
jgi:hypothetical protein